MVNLLKYYGLDQLTADSQMLDYLTIRISRSQLEQTVFEARLVPGPVKEGDYLLAALHSVRERYQVEEASICVGKGIWGAAFEAALVGLPLGCSRVSVEESDVTVDIHSIKRKVPAEITDEFVRRQLLDGIHTKEEYLAALAEKYREQELSARKKTLCVSALDMMREHSSFAPLDAQVEELYQQQLEARRYKAARKGYSLDDILGPTPEIRERKKQEAREKASRLAQFYEITAEMARREGLELRSTTWDRQAMELASEIIRNAFIDKFRVVWEQ